MATQRTEEGHDAYQRGGLHPVHLGDVYNGRYEVHRRLGYGRYSTVWLVKDQRYSFYGALKILSAECYGTTHDIFELEVLTRLNDPNNSADHPGRRYVPRLLDSFEHVGPNGCHKCLLLEPMGENFISFGTMFPKSQVPSPIMKRFTKQLLLALDYAHQSGIIHTDIQPRNIMVQIGDFSIIDNYLEKWPADVAHDPNFGSSKIMSQPLTDFYIKESTDLTTLNVALCDWGSASWTDKHLTEIIQPTLLRAPEVIIGAPWGPPVDIWNLGAVLIEILDAVRLFDGRSQHSGGKYKTKNHLEEMAAIFGPFPPQLLAQGDRGIVSEYFDEHHRIRDPVLRSPAHLEDWIESLDGKDKEEFVRFMKAMMKLNPGDRKTPKQLMDEPWIQHTSVSS